MGRNQRGKQYVSEKKHLEELTQQYIEEVRRYNFSKQEVEEKILKELQTWENQIKDQINEQE